MSSESHTTSDPGAASAPTPPSESSPPLPAELSCSFCERSAEPALALQCYPAAAGETPAGVGPDGGGVLCESCAGEVVELLAAWASHDRPEINGEDPIGEGYRQIATDCSFCADPLDSPALTGVELYDTPADGSLPMYANYTLCPGCRGVFGEFLCNVRAESKS